MTAPQTLPLPLGTARYETVDRATDHFVLCQGTHDDPDEWTPIAWLGGTDVAPIAEIAKDLDPETRRWVERELRRRIDVDAEFTTYVGILVDGVPWASWRGSLAHRVGSTGNWYGDMHWRHVSAEATGASPQERVPGELHGEGEHRGEEHGADEPRPVPDREP